MIIQVVKDYVPIGKMISSDLIPRGYSLAPKAMIQNILQDNSGNVEVLDIGFGDGSLGEYIKTNPGTQHWDVDGVDGWDVNCSNIDLFNRGIYRNVWHGLAQELPSNIFSQYNIICLLDVIEHLDADSAKFLLRSILSGMGDDSYLFISTPLWFMPQGHIQQGDLEEHRIGIPASSMMALLPRMYSIANFLVGGFVLGKISLQYIDFFQPSSNARFDLNMGQKIMQAMNLPQEPGMVYMTQFA